MKEKRLKYILFPVVFAIWGYTFYKYFLYKPDPQTPEGLSAIATGVEQRNAFAMELDSFKLLEEYRDPFLGRRQKLENDATEPLEVLVEVESPRAAQTPPTPEVNWSIFRYSGMVRETGKTEMVGLLSIRGKLHSVQAGDRIAGTQVLWLEEDSIGISFKEETQTIKK